MTDPTALNPLTLPLPGLNPPDPGRAFGRHILIEASAGTGKTYNIAALFARLVLVERLPVDGILVVTFTKAATAELKTRLRAQLTQALACVRGEDDGADETLQAVIAAARAAEPDEAALVMRLQAALNRFDGAAIYTIHGFCQRLLSDYAFYCGTPFDTETGETDPALLLTFAQDYWRRHISNDPIKAPLVADAKLTPQQLLQNVRSWIGRADVVFRQPESADLATAQTRLQNLWETLREQMADLAALFWEHRPQLNGNTFNKNTFEQLWNTLIWAAEQNEPLVKLEKEEKLALFLPENLRDAIKKKCHIPDADIARLAQLADFDIARQQLQAAQTATLLQLQIDAALDIRARLAEHKRDSRSRSFDDLLADTAAALDPAQNPQAHALAQAVSQQWQIALIDEFQDTDAQQYAIFSQAFAAQGRPLLMVGDPKQAIYRFRGADIHTYLQAVADTPPAQRYTLATNRRSHAALLDGISLLFQDKTRPFVLPGIAYPPIRAHRAENRLYPNTAPVHIRWLPESSHDPAAKLSKHTLNNRSAQYCADEIAATLQAARLGDITVYDEGLKDTRPLRAGDIAVLVRKHQEGRRVAEELKRRGVASVTLANDSVFASPEALALAALLAFWLAPRQLGILRRVLGSVLYAWDAAALYRLNQDEAALQHWLDWAQQARDDWQQHGIYSALSLFARHSGLEDGLLRRRQERSLTNFWQLAELLADAEQQHPAPAALHQWLDHTLSSARQADEAAQLRLESDEALVKIVTMHASKGLEYPLVFCPFAWNGQNVNKKLWQQIQSNGQLEAVAPELLDTDDLQALADEDLGETLRLYYVALTRARERLVLYAAPCSSTADNPLAYLLSPAEDTQAHAAFWEQHKNNQAEILKDLWQQRIKRLPESFCWHEGAPHAASLPPEAAPEQAFSAQEAAPRPLRFVRQTSFTALSRHDPGAEADSATPVDAAEAAVLPRTDEADAPPENDLLAFSRGPQAGVCLHALLEETDFAVSAEAQAERYPPILTQHGFGDTDAALFHPMIEAVRHTPLWPQSCLAAIPAHQQLAEMGFVLHMQDFSLPRLRAWLSQPHLGLPEICVQAAQRLDFATINGFLNGFIDLTCQDAHGRVAVIDYKSNHLGNRLADYHRDAMNRAVAEHHYYLQALIYAIAVARHLKLRAALPQMLSVRYLFLRGLTADSTHGVWSWDIASADLAEWL
ncbi:exodeoxyribonuclease V beta subunit [Neisseria sp. HSC-16F19]|nr:exodeoxyribonuclease V subunit beta [Neisseria sp. HSC-16F19]MCP2041521.1 exodeoxyribonuclease V beta subunit [Neisseria sp. HSC-16F19]